MTELSKERLAELRERVAGATGPDRALDAWAHEACGIPFEMEYFCDSSLKQTRNLSKVPVYTASIDAALALVERMLPGAIWQIHHQSITASSAGLPHCAINPNIPGAEVAEIFGADGNTPPLAILAALLSSLTQDTSK